MKTRFIMLGILAMSLILFAGCYPPLSLNPFYTEEDVVFDEDLLGMWGPSKKSVRNPDFCWIFTKAGENEYRVALPWAVESLSFTAHLFELKDNLYLDLSVENNEVEDDNSVNVAHMYFKVEKTRDKLKLIYNEFNALSNYLKDNPDAVSHTFNWDEENSNSDGSEGLVLTASTEELQDFIFKIRKKKKLFETIKLYRKQEK